MESCVRNTIVDRHHVRGRPPSGGDAIANFCRRWAEYQERLERDASRSGRTPTSRDAGPSGRRG